MLKPYRSQMAVMMALAVALSGVFAISPFVSRSMVDDGLLMGEIRVVATLVALLIVLHLAAQLIEYLQRTLEISISNDLSKKLKTEAFEHGLKLKPHHFREHGFYKTVGDALYDITNIMSIANTSFISIFVTVFRCLGALVGLIILDWRLSIFVVVIVPIKLWINQVMRKRVKKSSEQLMDDNKDYNSWFSSILSGVIDIKLWNLEGKVAGEYADHVQAINKSGKKLALNMAKENLFVYSWEYAWMQGVYILGAFFIIGDQLTFGGLVAFVSFANYVLSPINIIMSLRIILNQIAPSAEGLKRFYELEEENYVSTLPFAEDVSTIEFRDVSVSYEGRDVLKNVNFHVKRGEKVAIIGDNGSGKSTIINLLLRLQEPTGGCILMDGASVEHYNIEDYRRKFSVVYQAVHLFKGSVRENIALDEKLGAEFAEDNLLKFCTEAIEGWENQYETQVGNDGAKLSGGERQKIALLRALHRKSKILILDEPTSNYDKESEGAFHEFIRRNGDYDFCFIVTHRRDGLDYADRVLEVAYGEVKDSII
ncbi:MAG: ABC transporter ATP-binding protein/permease [Oscillospiraceae bacterium]|nr:ABC transporter ATP-binding protein/permease [Oscillospiraceae bacterium]